MKFIRRIALSALMLSSSAFAAWPDKPISIIVPWGAGGNTDTVARLVAQGLQKELGVNAVSYTHLTLPTKRIV